MSTNFKDIDYSTAPKVLEVKNLRVNFKSDSGLDFGSLEMDNHMILTGEKCVDYKTAYLLWCKRNKTEYGAIQEESRAVYIRWTI